MNLKKVVVFLIIFYYNFNFFPKAVSHEFCVAVYNIIPLMYLGYNHAVIRKIILSQKQNNVFFFISTILLIIAHCWGVMTQVINNRYDYSFLYTLILVLRGVYIELFMLVLIYKNIDKNNILELFMKFYVLSCGLYVLATLMFLLNPDLKIVWSDFIYMDEINEAIVEDEPFGYVTRYGLKGFSGFQETCKCTLAIIFTLYILKKKINERWILVGLFSLLGNLFYGRIGLIVSCIIVMIFAVMNSRILALKYLKGLFVFVLLCFGVSCMIPEETMGPYISWLTGPFEAFLNGIAVGKFDIGYSGNHLVDWYVMPDDSTLFMGEGGFSSNNGDGYYRHVDAGFMRSVYYFGLIGCLFYYLSYIVLALRLSLLGNLRVVLAFSFLVFFIMFEFKGVIFVNIYPRLWIILFLMGLDDEIRKRCR